MNLHPREQEMTTSYRLFRPEPRPSFDSQLEALPPDVKSVAESLLLLRSLVAVPSPQS